MCSVVAMVTCTAGMRAAEPVLPAWLKQASKWRAVCSSNPLPAPHTSTQLPLPRPQRKERNCKKRIRYVETIPRNCLPSLLSALQTQQLITAFFFSVFSPPQRQASPPHPPARPTVSTDAAPGVVEDSNQVTACHFLLPGPSHELPLLKSGDSLCSEPRSKGQGDRISDSPQRSRRDLFQSWVKGMNFEVRKYHSHKRGGVVS